MPKKPIANKRVQSGASPSDPKQRLTGDALPRRSLEKAIEVAKILRQVFAGKSATLTELAKNMGKSPTSDDFRYAVWAAGAYGLVNSEGNKTYALAELGRKIVAENYPGEGQEAKVKAVVTPTVLSKFFTDYNGNPIPPTDEHFANVLEDKFHVPRDRTAEAIEIIKANGRFAGILEDQGEGLAPIVRLDNVPPGDRPVAAESGVPSPHFEAGGAPTTGWDKTCFFITPIGEDGAEERRHANMMLNHVVRPVFAQYGFTVVRADEIAKTGLISQQVFYHLAKAKICVADLSFHNPNAFYELGVRHAFLLPTIQIIHKARKIPFDLSQGRTITIDTSDSYLVPDHLESAKRTLAEYVKNLLDGNSGPEDNPVAVYLPEVKVTIPK